MPPNPPSCSHSCASPLRLFLKPLHTLKSRSVPPPFAQSGLHNCPFHNLPLFGRAPGSKLCSVMHARQHAWPPPPPAPPPPPWPHMLLSMFGGAGGSPPPAPSGALQPSIAASACSGGRGPLPPCGRAWSCPASSVGAAVPRRRHRPAASCSCPRHPPLQRDARLPRTPRSQASPHRPSHAWQSGTGLGLPLAALASPRRAATRACTARHDGVHVSAAAGRAGAMLRRAAPLAWACRPPPAAARAGAAAALAARVRGFWRRARAHACAPG